MGWPRRLATIIGFLALAGVTFGATQRLQRHARFERESGLTSVALGLHSANRTPMEVDEDQTEFFHISSIRSGSVIVIGSADQSGRRHFVRSTDTAPSADKARAAFEPERIPRSTLVFRSATSRIERTVTSESFANECCVATPPSAQRNVPITSPSAQVHCCVPRVREYEVACIPCSATLLRFNESVAIYLADIEQRTSATDELAAAVCRAIESGVLAHVECWAGPVGDLDHSGRLTIILAKLDERERIDDVPVYGCVRGTDFEPGAQSGHPGGDVVYLSIDAEQSNSLSHLLVHELTHAALYSHQVAAVAESCETNAGNQIPGWLHEALAHVVESRYPGYQPCATRRRQFAQSPGQCPVVAGDLTLPRAALRGGIRASGLSFLSSMIHHPDDVSRFVEHGSDFASAVIAVTQHDFADAFREWTLCETVVRTQGWQSDASGRSERLRPRDRGGVAVKQSLTLYGTAFDVLVADHDSQSVWIEAPTAACLQVTVIEPD